MIIMIVETFLAVVNDFALPILEELVDSELRIRRENELFDEANVEERRILNLRVKDAAAAGRTVFTR